ncbi:hypothetical protein H8356DRAFT_1357378 [Neocallimastix lanati (nom. inval.)]|nr:hypothetical protein H8356DRAFT_1357378 [Neocallimastix sp. JGI-2020a]
MLQQKSFKQFFEIINKYSHIQKLDIIKFAIINNLNEIKNLFYPYWREDDGLIYISYLSATEKTSYSSNKKKGIDDFSKDIICSDRTLKKWKIMESISKMMKEHYYNEINKHTYTQVTKNTKKVNHRNIKRGRAVKNFYKKHVVLQNIIFSICYDNIEAFLTSPKNYCEIKASDLKNLVKCINNFGKKSAIHNIENQDLGFNESSNYKFNNTKINKINIPDRFVFDSKVPFLGSKKFKDLNIPEQLESGIRYLDKRLGINEKNLTNNILLMDRCHRKCRSETIIIHLKKKYIDIKVNTSDEKKKKEQIINEKISISIEEVYDDDDYSNKNIPTLGELKGDLDGKEGRDRENCTCPIGFCDVINTKPECNPVEINSFRYQDNYKLTADNKWQIVLYMIADRSYTLLEQENNIKTALT